MDRTANPERSLNILFVDDLEDDVLLFLRHLRQSKVSATWQRVDTQESLDSALQSETFDLAVVDYVMPALNGVAAIRFIHEHYPSLPIIATSGVVKEEAVVETLRAGATDYVLKDNLTRFLPALQRAIKDAAQKQRSQRLQTYQEVTRKVLDCLNRVSQSNALVIELTNILADMLPLDAVEIRPSHTGSATFEPACRPEDFARKDFQLFEDHSAGSKCSPLPHFTDMGTVWTGYKNAGGDPISCSPRDASGTLYGGFAKVPIRSDSGQVIGFLVFASRDGQSIDEEFIEFAETLSVSISSGLGRIAGRRKLREAARRWKATIDSIGNPLFLLDADQRITRCNRAFANLVSKSFEEIIGQHCSSIVHGFSEPPEDCPFRSMIETLKRTTTEIELDRRCFSVTTDPILDDEGNLTGAIAVMSDVTEVKLSAVGRLAGGVAHDFNNLLTGICAFSEFGLEEVPPGTQGHESLQEIRRLTDSASALTRQLLSFSRKSPSQFQEVDLNKLVQSRQMMLSRFVGENIEVEFILDKRLWPIHGDSGQLEQVLVNLCINARDAMPDGGKLTIETFLKTLDHDHIGAQMTIPPGDYVCLTVCDTGTGMPETVIRRIFDPFYTTKGVNQGTGLGLATVKSIIDGYNGSVDVYSEVGRGTSFKLFIPRLELGDPVQSDTDESTLEIPRGTGRILLAEDNATVRSVIKRVLTDNGFFVVSHSRGDTALEALSRTDDEPYDLLIADIVLPGIPGDQLAARAAERTPELQFLFLSGYTDSALKRGGLPLKSTHFLLKPFSPRELLTEVHTILDS